MDIYVPLSNSNAFRMLSDAITKKLKDAINTGCTSIEVVCIGTDRSTGDSLGPLVGYKLRSLKQPDVFVHGDLDAPVHAKNLCEIRKIIAAKPKPFVIAIDACLGRVDHVGHVHISSGPIKPGSGVNKDLPPIGDMSIVGIVNYGGFMDLVVLQNTRLSVVMALADLISMSFRYSLWTVSASLKEMPVKPALPVVVPPKPLCGRPKGSKDKKLRRGRTVCQTLAGLILPI